MSDEVELRTLVVVHDNIWREIERVADSINCDLVLVPFSDEEGGPFYIFSPRMIR
jgi:hypothetical protein